MRLSGDALPYLLLLPSIVMILGVVAYPLLTGFLYGFTRGQPLATCASLGGIAAAEVIAHVGARPETPLKTLVAGVG